MSESKQPRLQICEYPDRKPFYLNVTLPTVTFALVLGSLILFLGTATAQQESSLQPKANLELQKLKLEIAKLKKEDSALPSWLTGVLGTVFGGVVGAGTTVWVARRTRRGGLDQSIHDKRLNFIHSWLEPPTHSPSTSRQSAVLTRVQSAPKNVRRWGEPCRNVISTVVAHS
jgi:hypothetical protein